MDQAVITDTLPDWIKNHIAKYLQDGEAGHYWDSSEGGGAQGILTTLLLSTTGRKSGRQLLIPLLYQPTGTGSYCVIGSKGGSPEHPSWFKNLQISPHCKVQVGNNRFNAIARVAEAEEREKLWQMMVNYFSPYAEYQSLTNRDFPVVVLDPA